MFNSIKIVLLLACLSILSACAAQPATQVKIFAEASGELISETQKLMAELDNSTIERDLILLAANKKKFSSLKDKHLLDIKPIYDTPQGQKVPIIKALSALQQYSDALAILSSADLREDIDLAAQKLYGSFSSMGAQYQQLTGQSQLLDEKSLGLITSLIDSVGITIVERKRREAIKQIVITSDPHIAVLADVIYKKLDVNISAVKRNYQQILNERILSFRKRAAKMKLDTRLSELRKLKFLADYLDSIDMIYATAKEAVLAVKEAHAILRKTVSQGKFSSAQLSRAIGDINSLKKHLKSFSRTL